MSVIDFQKAREARERAAASKALSAARETRSRSIPYPCMFLAAFPRAGSAYIVDSYGETFRTGHGSFPDVVQHEICENGEGRCVAMPGLPFPDEGADWIGLRVWEGTVSFVGAPDDPEGDVDAIWEGHYRLATVAEVDAYARGVWREWLRTVAAGQSHSCDESAASGSGSDRQTFSFRNAWGGEWGLKRSLLDMGFLTEGRFVKDSRGEKKGQP